MYQRSPSLHTEMDEWLLRGTMRPQGMKFHPTTNILLHCILNAKFQRGKKSFEGGRWLVLDACPLFPFFPPSSSAGGDGSLIISDRPTPAAVAACRRRAAAVPAAATNGTKEQHSSRRREEENVISGIQ